MIHILDETTETVCSVGAGERSWGHTADADLPPEVGGKPPARAYVDHIARNRCATNAGDAEAPGFLPCDLCLALLGRSLLQV